VTRKFKVGDKVKIVKKLNTPSVAPHDVKLGKKGVISAIVVGCNCPYFVKLRGGQWSYFNARELELIKRKGD